jgi:glycerol-3-phosphate acyltransferase PlsY
VDWILVPVAYLVGSLQWGLYVVRLTKRVDIRTMGSGKTGATNVLRASGKAAAASVFLADVGKGIGMTLLARALSVDPSLHAVVAAAVLMGHVWPVLAGFQGGRGIAPGVGASAGLDPLAAVIGVVAVFAPVVGTSHYVSLGSVLAVLAVMGTFAIRALAFDTPMPYLWFALGGGSLIIAMHRDNIKRLLHGNERKIGQPVG